MKLNRFGSSMLYVLYALCSSDKFFPKRQIHWQTSIKQLFRILTSNAFDNMRLFCAIVLWMKSFVFNHIAIERIRWNTTMKIPKNNRFLLEKNLNINPYLCRSSIFSVLTAYFSYLILTASRIIHLSGEI